MARFCTKCGNQVSDQDFFCAKCGSQISYSVKSDYSIKVSLQKRKIIVGLSVIAAVAALLTILLFLKIPELRSTSSSSSDIFSETSSIASDNTASKSQGLCSNPEIAIQYIDFIKYGFGEYGDIYFAGYYLYDMDKDGCEELIIKAGTCEADAIIYFYKYLNGKIESVGDISGGHSSLYSNSKDDGLTIHYGHQGVEWIDSVKIKGNTLNVTEVMSKREVEEYVELDYCMPLAFYAINDMTPLEVYGGADEYTSQNSVNIDLDLINTSVSAYLEDYSYSGGHYLSDWENNFFTSENRAIYNLELTGTEKNFYLYAQYATITARGDTIIGVSQEGFQLSDIDNTYQLLKWLGGNYAKLVEYDPEIIYKDQYTAYLKWEANNGYLVIYTTWYDGLTDWKESSAWNYCLFAK